MANRNENEGRAMGADRERDREVGSDSGRGSNAQGGQSAQSSRRSNRGFASMDRGKQKEIASKGGKAAHAKGTAHEFDSNEAREAGRKGGLAVSRNRDHMAMIGRRGGEARGQTRGRAGAQGNGTGVSDRDVTQPAQSDRGLDATRAGGTTGTIGGESRTGGSPIAGENAQGSRGDQDSYGNH